MREKEWNEFIDTGKISDSRVMLLSYKIQQNQELTDREIAMFQSNGAKIETQLRLIMKRLDDKY